jgi:uracil phosphoribosyltransferase
MKPVTIPDHPLLRHKLTLLRDRYTPTGMFRQVAREISLLMAYEVMRDLPLEPIDIETPMEPMRAEHLAGKKLCLVSILRAGNGILDGMLDLVPSARVGHIGMYRDPDTLQPVEYYLKLPGDIAERLVILVDPMLATGHSAIAAATRLKQAGVTAMKFVCLIAAPEGIAAFT